MSNKFLSTTSAFLLSTSMLVADVPKVTVDIAPVHSLVSSVMKGVGKPDLIIPAGASPHEYQLKPSNAKSLEDADVVFWIGEDLTPWLEKGLESLAKDASITSLLGVDGIELLSFREGALFEAHDHGDHDDHDDHAGHGHGDHAFEWAGVFELSAGTYKWSFAKVDGAYADPAMKMAIVASDHIEDSEEAAEAMLESDDTNSAVNNDVLRVSDKAYTLNFDDTKDMTVFTVKIEKDGAYAFFTEHMPFEFEASEHFFKDLAGTDVEPIAQEPDMGHHDDHHSEHAHKGHDDHDDHDHGKKKHDDHDDHGKKKHDDHDDHDDHGKKKHDDHDDHEGHAHGEHDPHAWLSPKIAKVWLNSIAAKLSEVDPDNAASYFSNAKAARDNIDVLVSDVNSILDPIRDKKFVVFHDAYQYFEKDFGISASGAISLGDASDPSPARLAEIRKRVVDEAVACVLAEPQYKQGLVKAVVEGTDANTAVIDPLGVKLETGPSLYENLIRNLATNLAKCF